MSAQSLTGAKEVPDVCWEYWGWIDTMETNRGLYGLDEKRVECHDRLCEYYKITKEQSKIITDNLNNYTDAVELHFALLDLSPEEK